MAAKMLIAFGLVILGGTFPTLADQFGSGGNTFTIDFAPVGNPGNGDDTGAIPMGGVGYNYRIGVTEVPNDWIVKAKNLGLSSNVTAPGPTGNQPAVNMDWYEAAAFVNWLNTSTGHQAAYNLTFGGFWSMEVWTSPEAWQAGAENLYRHKDAYYFLPSEDEWYKAAFHKNDGVTANYWNYATQSDSAPTAVASGTDFGTAVYSNAAASPADVGLSGGLSGYGTRGQGGNMKEWMESADSGVNAFGNDYRTTRGGGVQDGAIALVSEGTLESRIGSTPAVSDRSLGFRVASVPEPSAAMLILTSGFACLLGRRNRVPRERIAAS